MIGLAILTIFQLLGIGVKELFGLPLPANVIGLVLFVASLFLGVVKLEWVEEAAEFLIRHMLLFFMPFVVGSMAMFHYMGARELMPAAVTLIVSTFVTALAAGWTARLLERRERGEETSHG